MQYKQALSRIRAGEAQLALNDLPDHASPDSLTPPEAEIAGLSLIALARFEEATAYLRSAFERDPAARHLNNLGHALLQSENPDEAILQFRAAVLLDPAYEAARINLVATLLRLRQGKAAMTELGPLLPHLDQTPGARLLYAEALHMTGQWQKAMEEYQRTLEGEPTSTRALNNLCSLLYAAGDTDAAMSLAERCLKLDPTASKARIMLSRMLVREDRLDDAMDLIADGLELNGEDAMLTCCAADVWREVSNLAEASNWYHQALRLQANLLEAEIGLARVAMERGEIDAALPRIAELALAEEAPFEAILIYAELLFAEGDSGLALEVLGKRLTGDPRDVRPLSLMGQIYSSAGDNVLAIECFQKALEFNPGHGPSLSGLAVRLGKAMDERQKATMVRLTKSSRPSDGAKAALHSGLYAIADSQGQYEDAAKHARTANALQWQHQSLRGWSYQSEEHERWIDQVINVFNADFMAQTRGWGSSSERPAFIVAMPRSGTTLTEQILACHPQVLGVGERTFASRTFSQSISQRPMAQWSDALTADECRESAKHYEALLNQAAISQHASGALRIVDKMPDNYSLIGWILTLFPEARIIHVRRDLRDVALSCWNTQFGKIQWASEWAPLQHRMEQYLRIMAHWREAVPGRFLEINYSDLVGNQEQVSRQMVDYLGLKWDPACLRFFESKSLIRTASINQVRKPMYQSSLARWKRYRSFLPELNDIPSGLPESPGPREFLGSE